MHKKISKSSLSDFKSFSTFKEHLKKNCFNQFFFLAFYFYIYTIAYFLMMHDLHFGTIVCNGLLKKNIFFCKFIDFIGCTKNCLKIIDFLSISTIIYYILKVFISRFNVLLKWAILVSFYGI